MSRPVKPIVDRHSKPLPTPRNATVAKVTLITDRVLEAPAEFVIQSLAENPMKKAHQEEVLIQGESK